jgi:hypothetical protein
MNTSEVRAIFNQVIATESNPDKVARLEIVREYFTNPDFRRKMEDYTWQKQK